MVSPVAKVGAAPEAQGFETGIVQARASGNAISYVARGVIPSDEPPEGNRNPEWTQVLSTRSAGAWASKDMNTASNNGNGVFVGAPPEYLQFTPSLALAAVQPFMGPANSGGFAEPPLSPPLPGEEGLQEKTIYLRDNAPRELLGPGPAELPSYEAARANGEAAHNPGFLPLVTRANSPGGEPFGGGWVGEDGSEGLEYEAGTSDLSHVVFISRRAQPGLYEWGTGGEVQLVSQLPNSTRVPGQLGSKSGHAQHNAVSNDGARVIWTPTNEGTPGLYVRDTITHETLRLDTVQPGASGKFEAEPTFQTASADGSRVFFTDIQRLTPGSKAGVFSEPRPDLYVAELSGGGSPGSPLAMTLRDLTSEGVNGESADVIAESSGGGVVGESEDGTRIYYVANGALSPDAKRGSCAAGTGEQPAGTTCNLYESAYEHGAWLPPKLIAPLSWEDSPVWGNSQFAGDPAFQPAGVSPNGEFLAFMSSRSLTGYDNEDVTSKAPGELLDEEVFLYDAAREQIVCASCNPDGSRPEGILDGPINFKDGSRLLVDRNQIWAPTKEKTEEHTKDNMLAGNIPGWDPLSVHRAIYQPRYISDSGRLFFNSPSKLVEASVSPKNKVYEYEPNGVGNCTSTSGCVSLLSSGTAEHEAAFLDASVSGNDAFFLTAEKLAPQDPDSSFDVYDARVCGAEGCVKPPGEAEEECASLERCRGEGLAPPSYSAPASTAVGVSGNVSRLEVLSVKEGEKPKPKPKPPTRAQKLAKALAACHKVKNHKKRVACEKAARKKYGPVKKKAAVKKASAHRASTAGGRR